MIALSIKFLWISDFSDYSDGFFSSVDCLSGLIRILIRNTKIGEKSDMAKSCALGFAACRKQELFVAQVPKKFNL